MTTQQPDAQGRTSEKERKKERKKAGRKERKNKPKNETKISKRKKKRSSRQNENERHRRSLTSNTRASARLHVAARTPIYRDAAVFFSSQI